MKRLRQQGLRLRWFPPEHLWEMIFCGKLSFVLLCVPWRWVFAGICANLDRGKAGTNQVMVHLWKGGTRRAYYCPEGMNCIKCWPHHLVSVFLSWVVRCWCCWAFSKWSVSWWKTNVFQTNLWESAARSKTGIYSLAWLPVVTSKILVPEKVINPGQHFYLLSAINSTWCQMMANGVIYQLLPLEAWKPGLQNVNLILFSVWINELTAGKLRWNFILIWNVFYGPCQQKQLLLQGWYIHEKPG